MLYCLLTCGLTNSSNLPDNKLESFYNQMSYKAWKYSELQPERADTENWIIWQFPFHGNGNLSFLTNSG